MEWTVTIGYQRGRGGWFITGQYVVDARDWHTARAKAETYCHRSERVLNVQELLTQY
jgi:hypothetical protein